MAKEDYRACRLCPRLCGVDRTAGRRGRCGETDICRLASALPHHGEEPSFSGTRGSGTLFFSGCAERCFFCQNQQISAGGSGHPNTPEDLYRAALELIECGVHNLNMVTGDHFWPHIEQLGLKLRSDGIKIPFLLNTSGYVRAEMVVRYAAIMDCFLPDFKFSDTRLAEECIQAADYPKIAMEALRCMVEKVGFLTPWDPSGRRPADRGVLVRHLILPGEVNNSLCVLRMLCREFGPDLPISIMSQFQPTVFCRDRGRFLRRPLPDEIRRVQHEAETLGFTHAYIQPEPTCGDYVPDFEANKPFAGNPV